MLRLMPSWSASNPSQEEQPSPTEAAATAIERARRLLEQLLRGARDDQPPQQKQ
jgi:hypothetical protein